MRSTNQDTAKGHPNTHSPWRKKNKKINPTDRIPCCKDDLTARRSPAVILKAAGDPGLGRDAAGPWSITVMTEERAASTFQQRTHRPGRPRWLDGLRTLISSFGEMASEMSEHVSRSCRVWRVGLHALTGLPHLAASSSS